MADTNISAVAALNLVTTASKAGKTVQQVMSAKSTGFDFKNILGKQTYNGTNDKSSVGRADVTCKDSSNVFTRTFDIQKADDSGLSTADADEITKRVSSQIVEKVTEDLDITEDKLCEIMQMLGITSMELLQPENLTALFANATGIENNPQELVLNSDFTGLYADVMDIASQNQALLEAVSNMEVLENPQVLEIFTEPDNPGEINTASAEEDIAKVQISDVTDETEEPVFQQPQVKSESIGTSETISASEKISTSENSATIASENTGATETTAATVQKERSMSEMAATAVSQSQTTSVNTVSELQTASEDNTVSGSQGMLETAEVEASNISETAVSSESIDLSETEMQPTDSKRDRTDLAEDTLSQQVSDESVSLKSEKQVMKTDLNSDSSSDERSFDDKSENRVLHTMINEQMQPEGVFEAFDVQPKYTSVNTTDIIRQIVDQISIAKTTGESVIEMQLNPENLGKLYINVTERNSEITARIAVSNETVKNALESQMAALRENLQDANIRVNDVEITIATHEFERNLEQNAGNENGRQDGQQFTHQSSSNGVNRTGHNEAASDEAGLAAQIMRDNGNSVDFMA
ncbi:MAG: flagellar hook-length control protein FliK [Lachnospiraceae bacterium]|nr:flagellar hook-length control protein FliK [Lachnospiraceae bacterium]